MKLVRNLLIAALVLSALLNVVLVLKYRMAKPIFSVNGQGVTRKDYDEYLELVGGFNTKRQMVERMVVEQEAQKRNLAPTPKDVDDAFDQLLEMRADVAQQATYAPHLVEEMKKNLRYDLERNRIMANDVPITDDEIKTEYDANPSKYDAPDKARLEFALILDDSVTKEIETLMGKDPEVDPSTIEQQYLKRVHFLGNKGVYTAVRPFGQTAIDPSGVFAMKEKTVKVIPPGDYVRYGAKQVVVRKNGFEPGHKTGPSDPKTKERIREELAKSRAKPWPETLNEIWKRTDFYSETPDDKRVLESLMFPDQDKTVTDQNKATATK